MSRRRSLSDNDQQQEDPIEEPSQESRAPAQITSPTRVERVQTRSQSTDARAGRMSPPKASKPAPYVHTATPAVKGKISREPEALAGSSVQEQAITNQYGLRNRNKPATAPTIDPATGQAQIKRPPVIEPSPSPHPETDGDETNGSNPADEMLIGTDPTSPHWENEEEPLPTDPLPAILVPRLPEPSSQRPQHPQQGRPNSPQEGADWFKNMLDLMEEHSILFTGYYVIFCIVFTVLTIAIHHTYDFIFASPEVMTSFQVDDNYFLTFLHLYPWTGQMCVIVAVNLAIYGVLWAANLINPILPYLDRAFTITLVFNVVVYSLLYYNRVDLYNLVTGRKYRFDSQFL